MKLGIIAAYRQFDFRTVCLGGTSYKILEIYDNYCVLLYFQPLENYGNGFFAEREPGKWHEETGGKNTLEAIRGLVNRPLTEKKYQDDPELTALLQPERQRQKKEMKSAIQRVVKLIYEDKTPS